MNHSMLKIRMISLYFTLRIWKTIIYLLSTCKQIIIDVKYSSHRRPYFERWNLNTLDKIHFLKIESSIVNSI